MNRIALGLFLITCIIIVSACGQYGDLYAPTEETTAQPSEEEEKQ